MIGGWEGLSNGTPIESIESTARARTRRARARRAMAPSNATAYVARDGSARSRKPWSLSGLAWGAIGVVDAFVRTLVVEGYADAYAGRGGGSRARANEGVNARGRVTVNRGGGASVRGFGDNVRGVDHSAPAPA